MAIKEQDKVFYEEAENGDKIINLPITRANNVEGLGRSANTYYSVGNMVYADSNLSVALKCTQSGTTSNEELDVSNKVVGESVEDGSVVWKVITRSNVLDENGVLPIANGGTGATNKTDARTNLGIGAGQLVPIGFILPYGGSTVPSGWLTCNGAAVSRTTYADLFAVIGTTYGAGDGSTTFNLPNLNNNSFLEGSNTAGTVKSAGLPNITGQVDTNRVNSNSETIATSALRLGGERSVNSSYSATGKGVIMLFDASRSNSIYGNSTTVQPKSVTVKFCIKY